MPALVPRKRAVIDGAYFYLYTDDVTGGESPEVITLKKERYRLQELKIEMQRFLPDIAEIGQYILVVKDIHTGETIFVYTNVIGSPHFENWFNEQPNGAIGELYNTFTSI